jgi:phage/plasmid-like protein (TIGR03299 family)
MAHEIDMTTGKAAIFTAGEQPWHKLGVNVAECQTSARALELASLDWAVKKWPVKAVGPDGTTLDVGGQFATVRTDTKAALGVVGDWYQPLQNRDAFDFMDALVGEKLAMFETAGAIKGGRRVWVLAKIPKEIRVGKTDEILPYVLLTNSHDGTSRACIIPTTIRVVCQNTLNIALKSRGQDMGLAITHTGSLNRRVAEAREKLGVVLARMDEWSEQANVLARKKLGSRQLGDFFAKLVENRVEKSQKKLLESFLESFESERQSLPGIKGSLWAAYNAVSEWADHGMGVFGKDDEMKRADNRLTSIWFGPANTIKQEAFALALDMAA